MSKISSVLAPCERLRRVTTPGGTCFASAMSDAWPPRENAHGWPWAESNCGHDDGGKYAHCNRKPEQQAPHVFPTDKVSLHGKIRFKHARWTATDTRPSIIKGNIRDEVTAIPHPRDEFAPLRPLPA